MMFGDRGNHDLPLQKSAIEFSLHIAVRHRLCGFRRSTRRAVGHYRQYHHARDVVDELMRVTASAGVGEGLTQGRAIRQESLIERSKPGDLWQTDECQS